MMVNMDIGKQLVVVAEEDLVMLILDLKIKEEELFGKEELVQITGMFGLQVEKLVLLGILLKVHTVAKQKYIHPAKWENTSGKFKMIVTAIFKSDCLLSMLNNKLVLPARDLPDNIIIETIFSFS